MPGLRWPSEGIAQLQKVRQSDRAAQSTRRNSAGMVLYYPSSPRPATDPGTDSGVTPRALDIQQRRHARTLFSCCGVRLHTPPSASS